MVLFTARDHVDVWVHVLPLGISWEVHNLCCHQLLWARRLPFQWYQWQWIHNWEWDIKVFCDSLSLPPQKETVQIGSYWRKSFKKGCWSIALHSYKHSKWFTGWEGAHLFIRAWPLGVRPCSNQYMGNTNWTWYVSFSLLGKRHKGGNVDLGEMASRCDQDALYEIPK